MAIQLEQATEEKLETAAAEAGVPVNAYVERLLIHENQRKNGPEHKEPLTVEEWQSMLARSSSTSGRDGRPWREFIHEGHKY